MQHISTSLYKAKYWRIIVPMALLMIFSGAVKAQQGSFAISGKVVSADDHQPLPRASVRIGNTGIGTATNASGMFALIVPAANANDTLKISSIGLKTQMLPLSSLRDAVDRTFELEKSSRELGEVTIVYYDADKILQKAISRIPENYINHGHILRGFYRLYAFNDKGPLQLSEAVFDVYNFGYADARADQFKLVRARNEKNDRDFSFVELGQRPNSVFEEDIINHRPASGFLSDEGIKKHKFEVTDVVDFEGHEAYQVDFKEKPGEKDEIYRGRIYIDKKTDAFIYFDFTPSPSQEGDMGLNGFIKRSIVRMSNLGMTMKQSHTIVGYQQIGQEWVLSSVSGDHLLYLDAPAQNAEMDASIKFNYQVTSVDTAAKESFSSALSRNDNINAHSSDVSSKFWKDYNILLSDYDTEGIFKQLQEINKSMKEKSK